MIKEVIELMKTAAVVNKSEMTFKSNADAFKFERLLYRNNPSAEFAQDWAKMMEHELKEEKKKEITDSLLFKTYKLVDRYQRNVEADPAEAKAILKNFWKYGDKFPHNSVA